MTNEEQIEEILIKSHNLGIRGEVISTAIKLMDVDNSLHFYDAINKAYKIEKNNLKK